MNILSIQPVEAPLEERLSLDFLDEPYRPITLEGSLLEKRNKRKSRKSNSSKHINKRHRTKRHYRHRKYHTK
jgi:hypothetical protein